MSKRPAPGYRLQVALLALLAVVSGCRKAGQRPPARPASFAEVMPARVLWAWEQPEDLRFLSPGIGVAYLAATVTLGSGIAVQPRHQPLRVAPGARTMAVYRVQAAAGSRVTAPQLALTLASLAAAAPAVAVQIDFDATESQLPFYKATLGLLRARLPASIPLSITALASWCGRGSWLAGLPVQEVVPMFFRMGGPRTGSAQPHATSLFEPRCRTSFGVSIDEPYPVPAKTESRVYYFAPQPWSYAMLNHVPGPAR